MYCYPQTFFSSHYIETYPYFHGTLYSLKLYMSVPKFYYFCFALLVSVVLVIFVVLYRQYSGVMEFPPGRVVLSLFKKRLRDGIGTGIWICLIFSREKEKLTQLFKRSSLSKSRGCSDGVLNLLITFLLLSFHDSF